MRLRAAAPPIAAMVMILAAALLPNPDDPARPPIPVPVSRAAYACPGGSHVVLGQVSPGESIEATELPGRDRQSRLERPDRWRQADLSAAVVIDQVGQRSGAAGFFTFASDAAQGGGLVVGSCPATVDQSWYLGLGSGAKHESRVILTNLSDVVAVADLAMWGREGPIQEVGARGLVIKPRAVQVIELNDLAAGEPDLALRVNRRRGALAVTVIDTSQRVFAGSEAIPPTRIPAHTQVIGGFPANAKGRSLVILNPGGATSRVRATVLGASGPVVPQGLERLRVAGGSIVKVDLPPGLGSGALAVRLESDQPVVAGGRFEFSKTDFATVASARPIDGPALVPLVLGGGIERPHLTLTALGKAGRVDVTGYTARMKRVSRFSTRVDESTTRRISLARLGDAAYAVVQVRGRVVGAAMFETTDGVASVPLEAAPMRVLGPDVRPAS
jgi:hypothetical protein